MRNESSLVALLGYILALSQLSKANPDGKCIHNFCDPATTNYSKLSTDVCGDPNLCVCKEGFEKIPGVNTHCQDINECMEPRCGDGALCLNTFGSFKCECLDECSWMYSSGKCMYRHNLAKGYSKKATSCDSFECSRQTFKAYWRSCIVNKYINYKCERRTLSPMVNEGEYRSKCYTDPWGSFALKKTNGRCTKCGIKRVLIKTKDDTWVYGGRNQVIMFRIFYDRDWKNNCTFSTSDVVGTRRVRLRRGNKIYNKKVNVPCDNLDMHKKAPYPDRIQFWYTWDNPDPWAYDYMKIYVGKRWVTLTDGRYKTLPKGVKEEDEYVKVLRSGNK